MKYIRHIVGEINSEVQRCLICGKIVCDNRGLMYKFSDGPPPKGYRDGEVFVSETTNPTVICIELNQDESFENCKP
jgi:hypothetical protein